MLVPCLVRTTFFPSRKLGVTPRKAVGLFGAASGGVLEASRGFQTVPEGARGLLGIRTLHVFRVFCERGTQGEPVLIWRVSFFDKPNYAKHATT